jgi:predicted RNase H-like HicB family nuclease
VITKKEKWYVARCLEPGVVSQGRTVEEAQANLMEAVVLYIEGFGHEEIPAEMGEVMLYPMEVTVNA